ncbi:MAG TPA: PilZ domain-containing protein [Candidatus Acidoferrum sp.]|nr:PilZ domain-containing protein [Candidatus Acidoferrum sp.]
MALDTLNFVSFLSRSMGLNRVQHEKNDLKAKGHWGRLSGERGNERQKAGASGRSGADASEASDWSRASVAIPSYRRGEKRRSSRVTLAVPIRVDGENIAGEKFIISTVTVALSQFGCLIQLDEDVLVDQTLVLMNEHTRQSAQGRIVSTRRQRNGHKHVGVEFISPSENFWRMTFVKPGAKSLKRIYGTPET